MTSEFDAASQNGLTRKERMLAIHAAMNTESYRSLIQEILDEIDQDAGNQGKSRGRPGRAKFQSAPASG